MRKLLVVCALLCSVTFAQNADSSAISVDSAAVLESPSVHVDTSAVSAELKLSPLDHLGRNMLLSAFGWPLGFHLLGGVLTYKFSTENNDLMVARFAARQNKIAFGIAFMPGMMMGTFFPVLVPGYLYFISDNKSLNNTGAVAVQATAVAFLYNNILKAISGRAHPDAENNSGKLSRDFKWGFGRRGVLWLAFGTLHDECRHGHEHCKLPP